MYGLLMSLPDLHRIHLLLDYGPDAFPHNNFRPCLSLFTKKCLWLRSPKVCTVRHYNGISFFVMISPRNWYTLLHFSRSNKLKKNGERELPFLDRKADRNASHEWQKRDDKKADRAASSLRLAIVIIVQRVAGGPFVLVLLATETCACVSRRRIAVLASGENIDCEK